MVAICECCKGKQKDFLPIYFNFKFILRKRKRNYREQNITANIEGPKETINVRNLKKEIHRMV